MALDPARPTQQERNDVLGTIISGRPDGWDRKRQPDGPELDDIPDVISGPLTGRLIDEPDHGLHYFQHVIGDLVVDPATIERTAEASNGNEDG
jgi:hypothetical protein